MKYPKPVMRLTELSSKMGFGRDYLFRAYYSPGQDFAWKQNPIKSNSPILFDTAKFEEWRVRDIQIQARARRRAAI